MSKSIKNADMRPLFRWLLWILAGLIVLFAIFQIVVSIWGDDYVGSRLKKAVRQSTDSTYTLAYKDLDIHIYSGSVSIKKMRLQTDTSAFRAKDSAKPPALLFKGTVGKLKISGIHIFSALWGDELHIGGISIRKPDITAIRNPHPAPKDSSKQKSTTLDSTIYKAISNRYHSFKLGSFKIRQAHLVSVESGDTLSSLGQLNLTLNDIAVDSASARSGRIFITDDFSLHARNLIKYTLHRLNKVALGGLDISSDQRRITLDSLRLIPQYRKYKFSQKHGTQIDRIDLTIAAIKIHRVDFAMLVDSARFQSPLIEVNNGRLEDFHSKAVRRGPPQKKALYNTDLLNLKQQIKIDTVKIDHSYVSYSEFDPPAPKAGKVSFQKLNATILNITNYQKAIKKGENATMHAQARVMGKGRLDTHFTFPLDTKNAFHKLQGSLSSMQFSDFNPMLKYVAFAKADHGKLNHLTFKMTLNNDTSSGTLIMNYKNLKASVLDKKSAKQQGILKNLESFAANKFIIKKNNTEKSGMRAGKIHFQRDKTKGAFNFWWKSLLSGIKDSIK